MGIVSKSEMLDKFCDQEEEEKYSELEVNKTVKERHLNKERQVDGTERVNALKTEQLK